MTVDRDKLNAYLNGLGVKRVFIPGGKSVQWTGELAVDLPIAAPNPHVLSSVANRQRYIAIINALEMPVEKGDQISAEEAKVLEDEGKKVIYDILTDTYFKVRNAPKRNRGNKK